MDLQTDFKKSVFDAIGLNQIIWIDDRFAEGASKLVDEYLLEISVLHENENTEEIASLPIFDGINWELPFEVIKEDIPTDDVSISAFYSQLNKRIPDLSHKQFDELITLLNEASQSILHLSHTKWLEKKENIIETTGTKLFLIDLNFEKEGLPADHGESIICELVNLDTEDCYFVLFTSETNVGIEEEAARKSIIDKLDPNTDHHHFSVLSKNILDEGDGKVSLDFKSAEFLKRIFLRKLSSEMVDTVKTTISTSLDELKDILSQNSIYEVDTAIFSKSLGEGLSEFDLLHRLFAIKQKEVMHKNLTDNPSLIDKLKSFRSVQGAISNKHEDAYIKKSMMNSPHFISLRHNEMFDFSINIIHSPLSCGDVFSFREGEDEKQYILIDQLCDLNVRGSTGDRNAKEVLLIPFVVKKRSPAEFRDDQNLDKYYMMQKASDSTKKEYYRFDFSGAISVNSHLLDLAVFNTKGELSFTVGQNDNELLFLPGWIKRFSVFKESVVNGDKLKEKLPVKYSVFTMFEDNKFPVTVTDKSISMSGKRVKQLRTPFIEELMSSYFVDYKARTAFDMDFS
ncbi:hypothetical protein [Flocculibacter collagenilyticus]|uniref:hypothetical protein n=1 Tax=Flocculibacter collagenilyticus TaxID=2744479 RepID=UPI0018F55662|nr:hypothetical protein [Flocculibacter collagenilyticus]